MSKVILVTGSNTGIGYELVKLLAAKPEVQKVYLGARNSEAGIEAQNTINQEGLKNVFFIHLDVTDPASIASAKETIEKNDGRLDVLVNNAAITAGSGTKGVPDIDLATIRAALETNFFGLIQTTTAFIPLIRKSPQAVILNVSSELGSNAYQARPGSGFHHFVAYSTSKAAVNSYTIALARDLEAEGIKVNTVTPGFTSTRINDYAEGGKAAIDGARSLLDWALLEKDGPTCLFIDSNGKEFPW